MKVMFDVDGVLADFIYGFTYAAAQKGFVKRPWGTDEHGQWDFDGIMTGEQVGEIWRHISHTNGWWTELEAIPSFETMAEINRLPCEVVFCTNRHVGNPNAQSQTHAWLASYGIEQPNVITTKNKGEVARVLGITHSIDDKVENANCVHWLADSPQCQSFLIDRKYNRESRVNKLKVVATVEEFLDAIKD